MVKNLISGPILACLAQFPPPPPHPHPNFFVGFIIVDNFKKNVWSKLKKMVENFILGLI